MLSTVEADTGEILVRGAAVNLLERADKIVDGQIAALGEILHRQILAVEFIDVVGNLNHAEIRIFLGEGV